MTPTYNGIIDASGLNNPRAPWYIVNGAGGHYDGFDDLVYPLASYWANEWNKFTVHNSTYSSTEFISASNITVLDSTVLYKKQH